MFLDSLSERSTRLLPPSATVSRPHLFFLFFFLLEPPAGAWLSAVPAGSGVGLGWEAACAACAASSASSFAISTARSAVTSELQLRRKNRLLSSVALLQVSTISCLFCVDKVSLDPQRRNPRVKERVRGTRNETSRRSMRASDTTH
jgi:hypothetical protein